MNIVFRGTQSKLKKCSLTKPINAYGLRWNSAKISEWMRYRLLFCVCWFPISCANLHNVLHMQYSVLISYIYNVLHMQYSVLISSIHNVLHMQYSILISSIHNALQIQYSFLLSSIHNVLHIQYSVLISSIHNILHIKYTLQVDTFICRYLHRLWESSFHQDFTT